MQLSIIDGYYESLKPEETYEKKPGQLCYAHIVYPYDSPKILKLDFYDPKNERKCIFKIKYYSEGDEHHFPVKELKLREDELFYVYRGKKRLVVVLG